MISARSSTTIGALLLVALGWGAGTTPFSLHGQRIPVTVDIIGDEVLYSREKQMAYARGAVEVMIRRRDKPDQWVKITSGEADANLATGVTDASAGVRIETPAGIFTARTVHMDPTLEEFWLKATAAVVDLGPGTGDRVPRGYFRGQEMGQKRDIYYVLHGRVTTCDKEDPDWSIEADEINYNTRTGDMVIRHGRVRLYGLSIPMLSPYRISMARKKSKQSILPGVGWNKRDGVFFPWRLRLSGDTAATSITTDVKLTTKRGMLGRADAQHFGDVNEWAISLARAEDHLLKHHDYFALDRTPELSFTHHLYAPGKRTEIDPKVLDFSLTAGHYREDPEPAIGASHSALRLSLGATERMRFDRREDLSGAWWEWDARLNFYDTGDRYLLLGLEAGKGWHITDRLATGLGVRHHIKTGDTPLFLDVPDLNTEATPRLDWQINDLWRFNYEGRYDVGNRNWFDYTVAVHRQVHCITYYASYEKRRHAISVGIDLSGLMGTPTVTEPYDSTREPAWMTTATGGPGETGGTSGLPLGPVEIGAPGAPSTNPGEN